MKTARRKYRFKSREDAEQAQLETEVTSINRIRALMALYEGVVEWLEVPDPYVAGAYRFGLFDHDSPNGPRVMVVFSPGGQRPHIVVKDAFEWAADTIEWYSRLWPSDDEGRMVHHMGYVVREAVNRAINQSV